VNAQQASVIRVAVAGAENAPSLVDALQTSGEVELLQTDDPATLIRDDSADVGLVFPPGFESDLAERRTTGVRLVADESELLSVRTERLRSLLGDYAQTVVTARLEAEGVDPSLLMPFAIEDVNIASPRQMSGAFLGMMLPMFIVLWSLVGGMYTAIDVTAGEKERLTLEPLLTAPVGRAQVVLGKLLAVVTTSLVALVLAVGSMLVAFTVAPPVSGEVGASMGVEPGTAVLLLLATLPVVILFSALEMTVCLAARSFKEAQNYITPLQFIVLLPAVVVMVSPDLAPSLPAFAVPVFSTLVVLKDVFLGRVDAQGFAVMTLSSLIYAGAAIGLAIWQFGREKVLFRV
jgi:sodium transport system permease protein